jgi:cytochrome c oxidase cbb3-type subunit 3
MIRVLSIVAITAAATMAQQAGQGLYQANCAGCHGLDGRGGEHAPDIATTPRVQQLTDEELLRSIREGIPASGMPEFGSRLSKEQLVSISTYLRDLQGKGKVTALPGDPDSGHNLFFEKAGCSECHMIGGKGGFIAGDLSSYAASHTIEQIREAILNPNDNIDPHHSVVIAVTKNGQRYRGIIRNEDSASLQLQARDGAFILLDKSTLTGITREKQSLMPSDYGSKLSPAEINNLISYLMKAAVIHPHRTEDDDEQ